MAKKSLVDKDFRAGCPVLAVAVEDLPDDSAPRAAAAAAFARWTDLLSGALQAQGAERADADRTATLVVAAVEGSVAMCRAERSTRSLDRIGEHLEQVLGAG
ncbi:TetR family transcriptional regulator C-terminal domain-containing protein [Nocardia ignorata]|uniref:LmrA/YxaF family transcription factor n=1 Tax=Nocardia ignorata TaxID=145285 RepID=UPI003637418D